MARTVSKLTVNKFSGGLYSDFTELETPTGITVEEDNVDLTRQGTRRRRKGVINETAATYTGAIADTDLQNFWLGNYIWTPVAEIGNLVFLVLQIGNTLYFYDASGDPLSDNKKSFTVDLDTFKVPTVTTVASYEISTAVIKGALFVSGEFIESFYIQYDSSNDTISTTIVNIQIRDFIEQDHSLPIDQNTTDASPPNAYKYDINNQGWHNERLNDPSQSFGTHLFPVEAFVSTFGKYPSKNAPWYLGKDFLAPKSGTTLATIFQVNQWTADKYGLSLAPLGHYTLDAFRKDRSAVSGIPGFSVEIDNTRPKAVAGFSSRVFYLHNNSVYFSQLIQRDLAASGKCYQDADPTAETVNDLVDTDGGVVTIPEMGKGVGMFVMRTGIIVFADNGIWVLQGASGSGFSATSYQISKISSTGLMSTNSIIDTEGTPYWFGPNAISTVAPSKIDPSIFEVVNTIDKRLMKFYNAIPSLCRQNASGSYDLITKTLTWLYRNELDPDDPMINRFKYDRMLNYNTIYDAFYPYSFDTTAAVEIKRPFISGVLNAGTIFRSTLQDNVVTSGGNRVINSALDDVIANRFSLLEKDDPQKLWVWYYYDHGLGMVPIVNLDLPGANSWAWTFATLTNTDFVDFPDYYTNDNGEGSPNIQAAFDYVSYLNCFYQLPEDTMTYEQMPYVYVYTRNTDYDPPVPNPIPVPDDGTFLGTLFQGEWSHLTTYSLNDTVKYTPNSMFYYAVVGNTNVNPSTDDGSHWQEIPQWQQYLGYTTGGVAVWKNVLYISITEPNYQNEPGVFVGFWNIVGSI